MSRGAGGEGPLYFPLGPSLLRPCLSPSCPHLNLPPQAITARPEVVAYSGAGGGQLVVFGTGSYRNVADIKNIDVQTFYGIRDDGTNRVTGRSSLQQQSIIAEFTQTGTGLHRVTSKNTVDYSTSKGWYIDFSSADYKGERIIADPVVQRDSVRFFTFTVDDGICSRSGGKSWYMQLNTLTGARSTDPGFDVDGDNKVGSSDLHSLDTGEKAAVSGFQADGLVKTPDFLTNGSVSRIRGDSSDGNLVERVVEPLPPAGRQSWSQIR